VNINSIDPIWFNMAVVVIFTIMWMMVEMFVQAYKDHRRRDR
jgi:hypothetical protein